MIHAVCPCLAVFFFLSWFLTVLKLCLGFKSCFQEPCAKMNMENQFCFISMLPSHWHCYSIADTTPDVLALMVLIFVILGLIFKRAPLKCLQAYKEHFHIEVKCMFIFKSISTFISINTGNAPDAPFLLLKQFCCTPTLHWVRSVQEAEKHLCVCVCV